MTAEALTDRPSSAPQPPDGFLAKAAVIVYATFTKVGETKSSASDAQLGLPAAHLHPAVASPQGRTHEAVSNHRKRKIVGQLTPARNDNLCNMHNTVPPLVLVYGLSAGA